ncbi:hypothetical protein BDW02DRAFT_644567 [Decorospora gaudefroyi]|uniref:Uncharacterized protein n=1 Tax=Decorospora gaudefroyi TaxID=184978 RepID=A0A6A5KVE2_9PLEO|nr:hypothetical protein BDW02DRAFT_644567 [Decorospora gaudefroyi]
MPYYIRRIAPGNVLAGSTANAKRQKVPPARARAGTLASVLKAGWGRDLIPHVAPYAGNFRNRYEFEEPGQANGLFYSLAMVVSRAFWTPRSPTLVLQDNIEPEINNTSRMRARWHKLSQYDRPQSCTSEQGPGCVECILTNIMFVELMQYEGGCLFGDLIVRHCPGKCYFESGSYVVLPGPVRPRGQQRGQAAARGSRGMSMPRYAFCQLFLP